MKFVKSCSSVALRCRPPRLRSKSCSLSSSTPIVPPSKRLPTRASTVCESLYSITFCRLSTSSLPCSINIRSCPHVAIRSILKQRTLDHLNINKNKKNKNNNNKRLNSSNSNNNQLKNLKKIIVMLVFVNWNKSSLICKINYGDVLNPTAFAMFAWRLKRIVAKLPSNVTNTPTQCNCVVICALPKWQTPTFSVSSIS